jgi:hypothetical protein
MTAHDIPRLYVMVEDLHTAEAKQFDEHIAQEQIAKIGGAPRIGEQQGHVTEFGVAAGMRSVFSRSEARGLPIGSDVQGWRRCYLTCQSRR